jgi:2-polyprenyl-3-methyl-5-hydroxy-6-metoxy-1,4-benzoquinol methylase
MPAERIAVSDQRIDREASHYDAVAEAERAALAEDLAVHPEDLHDRAKPWLVYMDMPALTTRMLASLGDIRGRRVLDLGTGNGFLAAALAHRGAEVVAVDVSPAALDLARARAEASGVADRIQFQLSSAEEISVPDASVDAVCGLFVLHHTQLDVTARELARVMRPGAPGAFVETMAYNPVLSAARALLPGRFGLERASTDDEAPLSPAAVRRLGGAFAGTVAVEWPAVICFRMGGYIPALRGAVPAAMLRAADRALGWLPGGGRASYFGLVTLRRAA